MSATGIGAPVRRKEDQRFITGKGQYTDDINRPGQTYACFVRSPHAHANIKRIDTSAALKKPGCLAVFTGEDVAADKVGALFCGWMITSKDGSPMKAGTHPVLALGKVRYVGDHVALVVAETFAQAKDAAEAVVVDYEVLPAAADVATAQNPGQPQVQADAPNNTVYQWHLGDKAAVDAAFAERPPRHQDRPRQQPADPQRHRAARGHRRLRLRPGQLHAPHHQPEPARDPAGAVRLHRHRARAQAARDRPRRGRRLRLQDLPLRRGDGLHLGGQEGGPAHQVDRGALRSPSSPTPTAATTRLPPSWRSTATARSWRCGSAPRPTWALISRPSPPRCRPTSTRRCCPASTTSPPSTARWTASTPTPPRSMPTAAPAGPRPRSWSSGWWRWRPGRPARTRPSSAARTSSSRSRTRRPSS